MHVGLWYISTNQIYFLNKILVFYTISNPKNTLSFLIQFWSLKIWFWIYGPILNFQACEITILPFMH